jgi:hypothetical protein
MALVPYVIDGVPQTDAQGNPIYAMAVGSGITTQLGNAATAASVTAEVTRAEAAENELSEAIAGETARAETAESEKEPTLGNPSADGMVLSSTAAGDRSWITPSGGGGILSSKVVYASKLSGIHANSNVNTGGGTDDTATLQGALNVLAAAGGGTLVIDGAFLITGLNHPANVAIVGQGWNTGFYLAIGSSRTAIRNVHRCLACSSNVLRTTAPGTAGTSIQITSGAGQYFDPPVNPYYLSVSDNSGNTEYLLVTGIAGDTITVQRNTVPAGSGIVSTQVNITLGEGLAIGEAVVDVNMTLANLTINANGGNQGLNDNDWPAGSSGNMWCVGVFYGGFQNLTIDNVQIINAEKYGLLLSNGNKLRISGIRIHYDHFANNQDGIHFWGPMNDVIGRDGFVDGNDDGLAMNFSEYLALMPGTINPYCSNGGCSNFYWNGFVFNGELTYGVRILGAAGANYLIDNIVLENLFFNTVNGSSARFIISGSSNVGRVTLINYGVNSANDQICAAPVLIGETTGTGSITNVLRIVNSDLVFNYSYGALPYPANQPIIVNAGHTLNNLIVENCGCQTSQILNGAPGCFVQVNGSLGRVSIFNSSLANMAQILSIAGSVGSIELKGLIVSAVAQVFTLGSGVATPSFCANSERLAAPEFTKTYIIPPNADGTWTNMTQPLGALLDGATTISKIQASVDTGTSLAFSLEARAFGSFGSSGTKIVNAGITALAAGTQLTTFDNAAIAASAGIYMTTASSGVNTGTVGNLILTIYYTQN